MKKFIKIFVSIFCVAMLAIPLFMMTGCDKHVDYAAEVKLDFTTTTKKQEVTVRSHIDGDTTHFNPVANSSLPGCDNKADFSGSKAPTDGYAKARYLAIDTPESTGQIEPWGKKAAAFTKGKLEKATSIVIESDDEQWNIDSTGSRYLLWVWYIPEGGTEYRNLNIEILQEGLAYGSSTGNNRYGDIATKALEQAEKEQLYIYSGEDDPDFDYSTDPKPVTLKDLRFNPEAFANKKVAVKGLVTADFDQSAYIEDVFTDIEGYEGIPVRIGFPVLHFNVHGKVVDEILAVGNYVKVVGVVTYYENGGYYQITGIGAYNRYDPTNSCQIIDDEDHHEIEDAFTEIDAAEFVSNEKTAGVIIKDELVSMTYHELLLSTSVTLTDLTVNKVSTTQSGDNAGAMTLTCTATDGSQISVRTTVFDGKTAADYKDHRITVKGIVELYRFVDNNTGNVTLYYQIKCYKVDYLTVLD